MKKLYTISLFILVLAMAGCGRKTLPVSTFHTRDSVTVIKEKLVPVTVPGGTVKAVVSWDSLQLAIDQAIEDWQPGKETKIIYRQDKDLRASLSIYLDSLGNLVAESECKEQELKVKVKQLETTIREKDQQILQQQVGFGKKIEAAIGKLLVYVIVILVVFLIARAILYKVFK